MPEPVVPKPRAGILLPPADAEPEDDADDGVRGVRPGSRPWMPHDDEDDDDDDRRPRRRSRRPLPRPGKVTTVGGMLLGGGVWAICANLLSAAVFPFWCFWPGFYFGIVWGILAIIRGAGLLGDNWRANRPGSLVILQIFQVVNLDVVNVILGIIALVFMNDRQAGPSFRGGDRDW